MLAPVCWIAALICPIAMSAAFWPGGPKGARSPVSGRIPDHEVELRLAAASVVVIVVAAAGRHAKDQHETGYCGEEPLCFRPRMQFLLIL